MNKEKIALERAARPQTRFSSYMEKHGVRTFNRTKGEKLVGFIDNTPIGSKMKKVIFIAGLALYPLTGGLSAIALAALWVGRDVYKSKKGGTDKKQAEKFWGAKYSTLENKNSITYQFLVVITQKYINFSKKRKASKNSPFKIK